MIINKMLRSLLLATTALLFITPGVQAAESDAIKTMAGIMMHVNHFPGSDEKATLKKIADDAAVSAHSRAIAMAMINMEHSVTDQDKAALQKVSGDASASAGERELAGIVMNFMHKPREATHSPPFRAPL
ncbi:MAG: hypothetical protein FD130_2555 [Halothiobacillaceae bacterium]|nr:MAG: hypothetical protein FD130_2555 [Halothiobacillaceae bacterium]